MLCADGLHWNHRTRQCDLRERANCMIRRPVASSSFPLCPRDTVGLYAHPFECDRFLYCYHGHMTVQQCPFYYNWDVELERCELRTVAKCGTLAATATATTTATGWAHVPEYEYGH